MTHFKFTFLLALLLFLLACNSAHDATLLHGKWKVVDWREVNSGKSISQKMFFDFKTDKSYIIDYGAQKEEGSYYISGEYLHTKENQGIEKSVLIKSLSKDSLVLNMNRAGSLEEIALVRP